MLLSRFCAVDVDADMMGRRQIAGTLFIIGWNIAWTSIIMRFIKYVLRIPLRMSDANLLIGDEVIHGVSLFTCSSDSIDNSAVTYEEAYCFDFDVPVTATQEAAAAASATDSDDKEKDYKHTESPARLRLTHGGNHKQYAMIFSPYFFSLFTIPTFLPVSFYCSSRHPTSHVHVHAVLIQLSYLELCC
jgi:hypothetical protein